VQAARGGAGRIATLIVPANHAWEPAQKSYDRLQPEGLSEVTDSAIEQVAAALGNGRRTAIVVGGSAMREAPLELAGRIAAGCNATLLCETFPARLQRGAGRVPLARIPYFAEQAIEFLKEFEQMILIGAQEPVAFFAYPGVASLLAPPECVMLTLAGRLSAPAAHQTRPHRQRIEPRRDRRCDQRRPAGQRHRVR
jgi:acetolactate synthase-1/2/3 large subunit